LSGRYLDTFNKNIEEKKWKDKLFWYDNFLMEFILEDRLRHYGYSCGMKMHKVYWVLAPFFVFLPMRYELRIAIHNIKIPNSCGGIILALGKTLIFYILRVFLYFKFIWKKSNGKIFLADFFNQGMRHSGN
jgi:hypothetical protein